MPRWQQRVGVGCRAAEMAASTPEHMRVRFTKEDGEGFEFG